MRNIENKQNHNESNAKSMHLCPNIDQRQHHTHTNVKSPLQMQINPLFWASGFVWSNKHATLCMCLPKRDISLRSDNNARVWPKGNVVGIKHTFQHMVNIYT